MIYFSLSQPPCKSCFLFIFSVAYKLPALLPLAISLPFQYLCLALKMWMAADLPTPHGLTMRLTVWDANSQSHGSAT